MRRVRFAIGAAIVLTAALVLPAFATKAAPTTGWVPTIPTSQQSRQFLTALPGGTAFALDVGGQAITLWHSGNFGVTWDALTYLPEGTTSFAEARFATDKVGYLIDFDRILKTSDGATSPDWRRLLGPRLPKGDSFQPDALGVTGETVAFGGSQLGPLRSGCNTAKSVNVWTSHDGGRRWVTAAFPKDTLISQVRYVNARVGVALAYELKPNGPCSFIGTSNSVYVTRDGGAHFSKVLRCAAQPGEICTAAAFIDSQQLLVGRNDGSMAMSSDGGRSFREQAGLPTLLGPKPTKSTTDAAFWIQGFSRAGQSIFATTKLAGTYLSSDGGATWNRETSCDSAYSLGIGEVAAFDAERAIAGGPTCVATRVAAPTTQPTTAIPAATPGIDWAASAGGRSVTISGGQITVQVAARG